MQQPNFSAWNFSVAGEAKAAGSHLQSFSGKLMTSPTSSRPQTAPDVRYSLLSIDPHRRLTASGDPMEHAFSCLHAHRQLRIKVVIAITAYNESWPEITSTIKGVVDNVCELAKWQAAAATPAVLRRQQTPLAASCATLTPSEVAVIVIFDGREKMSETMFGSYTDGCVLTPAHRQMMADAIAPIKASPRPASSDVRDLHLFELLYQTERSRGETYNVGLNLLLAVKEKNGGKLNSHVWYFRTFCPLLRPRYCFLLDAGTVPDPTALLRLYADMEDNADIGGCAGEICVDRQQQSMCSFVVSAQLFEYAAANLMDKSMESVFGFIGVLPGAFSAYRYEAIVGAPMDTYFRLEDNDATSLSAAQANAYLAEDRLLGFEIVAKDGHKWTLHYDHAAQAFTDVPSTVGTLIRQRRRWGNGTLFAQLLALSQWWRLIGGGTRHSVARKAGFVVLFAYYVLQLCLSLLVIGNTYFAYAVLFRLLGAELGASSVIVAAVFKGLMWIFQLLIVVIFVYSLGNRPEESETVWSVCVHLLGGFNTCATALLLWLIHDFTSNWIIWTGGLSAFGAIILCAIFQRRLSWILASLLQFYWMAPMMMLMIPIYSLCNTHDVSWGTRDAHATATQAAAKAKMDSTFREFRSRTVILWCVLNLVFTQALESFSQPSDAAVAGGATVSTDALFLYVLGLAGIAAFMLGLRVAGAFAYWVLEGLKGCCCNSRAGPLLRHCCRKPSRSYATGGGLATAAPSVMMLQVGSGLSGQYHSGALQANGRGLGAGGRGGGVAQQPPPQQQQRTNNPMLASYAYATPAAVMGGGRATAAASAANGGSGSGNDIAGAGGPAAVESSGGGEGAELPPLPPFGSASSGAGGDELDQMHQQQQQGRPRPRSARPPPMLAVVSASGVDFAGASARGAHSSSAASGGLRARSQGGGGRGRGRGGSEAAAAAAAASRRRPKLKTALAAALAFASGGGGLRSSSSSNSGRAALATPTHTNGEAIIAVDSVRGGGGSGSGGGGGVDEEGWDSASTAPATAQEEVEAASETGRSRGRSAAGGSSRLQQPAVASAFNLRVAFRSEDEDEGEGEEGRSGGGSEATGPLQPPLLEDHTHSSRHPGQPRAVVLGGAGGFAASAAARVASAARWQNLGLPAAFSRQQQQQQQQ